MRNVNRRNLENCPHWDYENPDPDCDCGMLGFKPRSDWERFVSVVADSFRQPATFSIEELTLNEQFLEGELDYE